MLKNFPKLQIKNKKIKKHKKIIFKIMSLVLMKKGIYLGITNSYGEILRNGYIEIIHNDLTSNISLSIMSFIKKNNIKIG